MTEFCNKIGSDIDNIVHGIIGTTKYPFSAQTTEFQELVQTVEITLTGIHDMENITTSEVANYLLIKYIHTRSAKRIKKELLLIETEKVESEKQDPPAQTQVENPELPIHPRIKELLSIPQPEQKSQAWLNQRQSYITASVFGDACGMKGPVALVTLILNKVSYGKYRPFFGNKATQWGEKYEDVCNAIYCYRNDCRVFEFGMIAHPEVPFLGASTDGVSDHLINIEIKSPFSRFITGIPPNGYWAQTQLQMAVLDLEMTHFLECSFYEYGSEEAFFTDFEWIEDDDRAPMKGDQITFKRPPPDNHHKEKGLIFEVVDLARENLAGDPKTVYLYSPIKFYLDKAGLQAWREETLKNILESENLIFIRVIPWILTRLSCVKIERDPEWFKAQIPILTEFWKDVEYYRQQNLSLEEIEGLKSLLVDKYYNFGNSSGSSRSSSRSNSRSGSRSNSDSESKSSPKPKKNPTIKMSATTNVFGGTCLLGDSDDEGPVAPIKSKSINKKPLSIKSQKSPPRKFVKSPMFSGCMLGDSDDEGSPVKSQPKKQVKSLTQSVKSAARKSVHAKSGLIKGGCLLGDSDDEAPVKVYKQPTKLNKSVKSYSAKVSTKSVNKISPRSKAAKQEVIHLPVKKYNSSYSKPKPIGSKVCLL